MRGYVAIAQARARVLLQYRAAAVAGFGTQAFWGMIRIMIFEAFYRSAMADGAPMRFEEVVSYVWLGQATLMTLPWNLDREMADEVRTGKVVYGLLRPVDLYGQWFARAFALRSAPMVIRALPMFAFAMVLLPLVGLEAWALEAPTLEGLAMWLVALGVAILLSSALTTLWSVALMWTVSGDGVTHLAPALVTLMSGMVIPLPLLPDGVRAVVVWLPFAGLVDLPVRLFSGHLTAAEAAPMLAAQLVWWVLLVALGRALLGRGVRRLVVQGG
ncbi:MAG: ABC transporter permease [Myxococcales bacterium]|nr:ABC transporter permease [Myxococcales bacterium]